jgi:hypothetical protein
MAKKATKDGDDPVRREDHVLHAPRMHRDHARGREALAALQATAHARSILGVQGPVVQVARALQVVLGATVLRVETAPDALLAVGAVNVGLAFVEGREAATGTNRATNRLLMNLW